MDWVLVSMGAGQHLINLNSSLSNIQQHCDKRSQYPSAQEVFKRCWDVDKNKMFSDLWWDDFLQVTSRVTCCSLRCLGIELYSWAVLKWGLKARGEPQDVEQNKTLDRAVEYTEVTRGNRVFICERNKDFILKFEPVSFR